MKHDLTRSCFQLWPIIGDEGDKISRKKIGKAIAEKDIFEILSPSEPIMRAIIEKMISPNYVLCYLPRVLEIFWEKMMFFFNNFGLFLSKVLEKIGNYIRVTISKVGCKLWRCILYKKMLPHFDFIL